MAVDIWDLEAGDVVVLDDGTRAEVVAPTEDGQWFLARYLEVTDPDDAWLVGTFDAVHADYLEAVLPPVSR
ncbi:MAG: hypothetical protein K6U88_03515 [Dehalococcoidia bacterium]|nr:hypothetical protein [Dehalococcoidia bacterium]